MSDTTQSPTQQYVSTFAEEMEKRLALPENRAKGDRPGWVSASPHALLESAQRNLKLLERALYARDAGDDTTADILRRAANTANFCMMVADVCGALPAPTPKRDEAEAVRMLECERDAADVDE